MSRLRRLQRELRSRVVRKGPLSLWCALVMNVTPTTDAPRETAADTVAIGVFDGEGVAHDTSGGELQALLDAGEAKPAFKHLAVTHADGKRWLLVGLGARDAFDAARARIAAATAQSRAGELGARTLC